MVAMAFTVGAAFAANAYANYAVTRLGRNEYAYFHTHRSASGGQPIKGSIRDLVVGQG